MAKVGLIDVDSHNFPNLAQMKISAYHKAKGDSVEWWLGGMTYDIVYKSRVFTDKYTEDMNHVIYADQIIKGGTGYSLHSKLTDEIENIYPDYSIYPQHKEAYGFLTRGCPRDCPFCIVSGKEGRKSHKVANLSNFWNGQKDIKLLDPNILACQDHEDLLIQLIESKSWVDFTQGLDIRLVSKDNIQLLQKVKTKMYHFAWDGIANESLIEKNLRMFKNITGVDRRVASVYVLTNYDTDFEYDLHRIYTLREIGLDPYVMIYDKESAPQNVRWLQRWVNNRRIWPKIDKFEDYDPSIA